MNRALAVTVAVALTAGLVWGSALPYTDDPGDEARIRLSWRAVGERVEECRAPTEAELAALPTHMRRSEICEARLAPFRLAVALDGVSVFEGRIQPGGARGDRPAYVFQEFAVSPGPHRLAVEFASERDGDATTGPALTLERTVTLAARDILLVTTDPDGAELVLHEGPR